MTAAKATTATRKPAPRKPQDRQPKAAEVDETPESTEIEVQGITLTLDQDRLDDARIMECIVAIEEGREYYIPTFLRLAFGDAQYATVTAHLADETGRVRSSDLAEFFGAAGDVMQSLNAGKGAK